MQKAKNIPGGFTIMGLIASVSILAVVLVPLTSYLTSDLSRGNVSNNESMAYRYAKDGIETVVSGGWVDYCNPDSSCYKKLNTSYALVRAGDEDDKENIIQDGQPSIFSRNLYFDKTNLINDSYLVTCVVEWSDNFGDHSVETKRIISN